MSKINQWMLTRLAELGLSVYDFDNEAAVREQLQEEIEMMTVEHEEFMDLSGSLHNASYIDAEWKMVEE